MIAIGSSNYLGIALSDRAITCTEVSVRGDRRALRHAATLHLSAEQSLERPKPLGEALSAFLRSNGFTASRAVVGVPARWLIALERDVPPAGQQQVRAMLRLQAERLAVSESGELVFDYAAGARGVSAPSGTGKALLVGMLKKQLERVEQLIEAADLSLIAVTSTALTLASVSVAADGAQAGGDLPMMMLGRGGAEVVFQHAGSPRMLRHVSMMMGDGGALPPMAPLGAELRRAVALAPNGQAGAIPPKDREVLLFDGVGLSGPQRAELSDRLGVAVRSGDADRLLGVDLAVARAGRAGAGSAASQAIEEYVPAVSLALAGARRQAIPVDFAHSRLATAPAPRVNRRAIWGGIIGLVAVGAMVALYVNVRQKEAELEDLNTQLSRMRDDVKDAQANIDRVNFGRGFFVTRPPMLDALRELSLSFREDETIWTTSFSLRETGAATLVGRAADQRTVLNVRDRLQQNPHFTDVKLLDLHDAGGQSRDQVFSLAFNYVATAADNTSAAGDGGAVEQVDAATSQPAPGGDARAAIDRPVRTYGRRERRR